MEQNPGHLCAVKAVKARKKANSREEEKRRKRRKWLLTITPITLVLSTTMSYVSEGAMEAMQNVWLPLFIILLIVVVGIVFDMIGVAVTSAEDIAFISMASRKEPGARDALFLLHNADKVSSICNDVVGDICGIVSGAAGGVLVVKLLSGGESIWLGACISGIIASLTIGGKAACKGIAISKSTAIVLATGRIIFTVKGFFKKLAHRH